MACLYWIYDETCSSVVDAGYVGVSDNPKARWWQSKSTGRVPKKSKYKILYEGSVEDCLKRELKLRPGTHIGWNTHRGGSAPSLTKKRDPILKRAEQITIKVIPSEKQLLDATIRELRKSPTVGRLGLATFCRNTVLAACKDIMNVGETPL